MSASSRIPRVRFATLPTPVEELPRLHAALAAETGGRCPRLLVKRDDLTGLALGGNKTRKLEFVLAEALANGAKTLVTVGAAQSNHCRQTAALAARVGLGCLLVLSGEPEETPSGNLLLDRLFGAEIHYCARAERDAVAQQVFDRAWQEGRRPYFIPLGASTAIGALAYEAAFQELLEQGACADWLIVPSSSGGTQAGLALGARRAGWPGRVLGISIDEAGEDLQRTVAGLATQAAERLNEPLRFDPAEILVNDEFLGAGYGVPGEAEGEAIALFARTEGLLLDPVYTARAAAGLLSLVHRGAFAPDESVLFWHTGGAPALFAGRYQHFLQEI